MNNIILHIESNSKRSNLLLEKNKYLSIDLNNNLNICKNLKNNTNLGLIRVVNNKLCIVPNNCKFYIKCNKLVKLQKNYIIFIGKEKLKILNISKNLLLLENIKTNKKYIVKKSTSIGKDINNNICINNNKISNIHSKISYKNSYFYIIDNNSSNGTYIIPLLYFFNLNEKLKINNIDIHVTNYSYGIYHDIGKRPTFEDTFNIISKLDIKKTNKIITYLAVFDGHGGNETSQFCENFLYVEFEKLLNLEKNININVLNKCIVKAINNIDKYIFNNKIKSGTTANICILFNKNLICVNIGDSRSILCRKNKILQLSFDHKPMNEKEYKRITNTNGFVQDNRLNGRLAVSRAIGDNEFKHSNKNLSPLISHPDIYVYKICENDKYIVVACDGLWDVMSHKDVCDFIDKLLLKNIDLNLIAKYLTDYAINALFSTDNVTVLILKLI